MLSDFDTLADAGARRYFSDGIAAPRDALARFAADYFALVFPTIEHLERAAEFESPAALLAFAASKPVRAVMPDADGDRTSTIPPALEGVW